MNPSPSTGEGKGGVIGETGRTPLLSGMKFRPKSFWPGSLLNTACNSHPD